MAASFGEKLLAEVHEETLDQVRILRFTYLASCIVSKKIGQLFNCIGMC